LTSEIVTNVGRFELEPHGCFACGELNEGGLRLVLHAAADLCWTELVLEPRFAGWEGIAHGGIVTTILDEVMAWSLVSLDAWGLTARISVEFKRPVPIGRTIRGEGRLIERRKRLMTTTGRLLDAATGDVYAAAEALYVAAPEDRKQALKERYRFRLVAEDEMVPGAAGDAILRESPVSEAPA
jgi:acyl-coenzyme A thioesterase PaaI-like protein